jgi:hypothetical protein
VTSSAEPLWYLRVNTLRQVRLSDPVLRGLLTELAEAERAVSAAAQQCSDQLYELIGGAVDDVTRTRLIGLRRAIHNDRAPRNTEAPTPAVASWLCARERRRALRDRVTRGYEQAAENERGTLAELLGDENLLCALALVAPEVHQEARRYRAAVLEAGSASARVRKAERGLLQYVTRAMVRTSPLSRFTAVGIGAPDETGIDPDEVRFQHAVAFPGLDRVLLGYVLGGLDVPGDERFPDTLAGLPPTAAEDGDKLIFLRPADAGAQRVAVPIAGPVRVLLDAVGMGPRRVRSIVSDLVTRLGCPPEVAATAIRDAVGKGILCTFDRAEADAWDLAWVLGADHPETADLRVRLPRLAEGPASGRAAELDGIRADLAALSTRARRPAQISVTEDYVLPPLRVATGAWRRPLVDLAAGVELLSVFDWLHDVRAVLAAAFVERFGEGATVALAEHAGFLVSEVSRRTTGLDAAYREGGTRTGLGPADGSIERLQAVRRTVTEVLTDVLTKAADEPEVVLSASEVTGLTAELPERFRRDPLLYGILVQRWGDRLVFNDGLPGHGTLYGRLLDADRKLGGQALGHLAERLIRHYGWDGSTVVEDLGLHRLAINAHPPVLPVGLGPDDWFSLRLAHDPDTDLLHVQDGDGRRLAVLHLGTGHPALFPAPLAVASALVMSGRLANDLPNIWHSALPEQGRGTVRCPRMSVGDVVLSRSRWYGGAEFAEAVATGPAETDRLLALTAWRARHDVPEEIVIKTAPEQVGLPLDGLDVRTSRLVQKPQYVDLSSALGVRVLPRMLERRASAGGTGYLEEAAPSVAEGGHAAEWVVEIGRPAGGLFRYGGELG